MTAFGLLLFIEKGGIRPIADVGRIPNRLWIQPVDALEHQAASMPVATAEPLLHQDNTFELGVQCGERRFGTGLVVGDKHVDAF